MVAPAVKGIIIVGGVVIAAGVALYENEQVREWFEKTRTDITQSFQDWVDSLTPEGQERLRRRAGAHVVGSAMPGGNPASPRSPANERSPRRMFDEDTERKRLGQEYLERRKRMMEARFKKQKQGQDGAGESIPMEDSPSSVIHTGTDVQGQTTGLRRRRSSGMQPRSPHTQQPQTERYPESQNVIAHEDKPVQQSDSQDTDVDEDARITISMSSADFFDAEPYERPSATITSPGDFAQPAALEASRDALSSSTSEQQQHDILAEQTTPTFRATAVPDLVVPPLEVSPDALSTSNVEAHNNNNALQADNHGVISAPASSRGDVSTDTNPDFVSDAGTETASHISRLSELGDQMHGGREDDVMSVASSSNWSEVDSATSEDR